MEKMLKRLSRDNHFAFDALRELILARTSFGEFGEFNKIKCYNNFSK